MNGIQIYYRHKKRGTTYEIIGGGVAQCSKALINDNDPVIVYQCLETDQIWVRPVGEFYDGRFEEVSREEMIKVVEEKVAEIYVKSLEEKNTAP